MKNSLSRLFFVLIVLSPQLTHGETLVALTKPTPTKTESIVPTPTETLVAKKEQAYKDLSSLTTRLADITTRLETAIKQLADNHLDVSGVTPLLENTKTDLLNATTNLLVLAPIAPTVATTATQATTLTAPATTKILPPPVVEEPTEEAVKVAVTSTETSLTSARKNLIDSIALLKTLISKAQTTATQ